MHKNLLKKTFRPSHTGPVPGPDPAGPVPVRLEAVSKIYRMGTTTIVALNALSLVVPGGQFTAVVGRSGSGK